MCDAQLHQVRDNQRSRRPGVLLAAVAVLLIIVLPAAAWAASTLIQPISFSYDPDATATTGSAAVSFRSVRIYDPTIQPSGRDIVVGFGSSAAEDADGVTQIVKTRPEPGADGGISNHIIEQQNGQTTSVTHQVEVDGQVVHQHQTYIGKYGGQRELPPEWSQFPDINAP
jgi:hypothetical protein